MPKTAKKSNGTKNEVVKTGATKANTTKVAFITGANRGLGLETARILAKQGISVVLGSRELDKGQAAAEQLRKEGAKSVEAVRFDVNRPADHKETYNYLDHKFGKLDILINNAGVLDEGIKRPNGGRSFNSTSKVSQEYLRKTFDTNFFQLIALTQTLLPLIKKAPAGRIVNLSSILGSLTLHSDPQSPIYDKKTFAYDASKTALNAFTVHLAQELRGTPIKVNSAHPGWVKTRMGGDQAPMELSEGGKTSAQLATLPEDGPSGGFFHLGQPLPW
jgi:NAD(P)-dependent dehydrogenase (short-subunit alcohol dehydrogenase family)